MAIQTNASAQTTVHQFTVQRDQGKVLNSPRFQAFPMDKGNDQWGVRDTLLNKCWSDDGWQLHDSGWASVLTHEESLQKVNELEHELLGLKSACDSPSPGM